MSDAPQKPLPFVYQFAAGAVAGVSEVCVSCRRKRLRRDSMCQKTPHEVLQRLMRLSLSARIDLDHVRPPHPISWSHGHFYWEYLWYDVKVGLN